MNANELNELNLNALAKALVWQAAVLNGDSAILASDARLTELPEIPVREPEKAKEAVSLIADILIKRFADNPTLYNVDATPTTRQVFSALEWAGYVDGSFGIPRRNIEVVDGHSIKHFQEIDPERIAGILGGTPIPPNRRQRISVSAALAS